MCAAEGPVGTWTLTASFGEQFGVVRLVRRGTEVGYRADYQPRGGETELVGYYRWLLPAADAVHKRWMASTIPKGNPLDLDAMAALRRR